MAGSKAEWGKFGLDSSRIDFGVIKSIWCGFRQWIHKSSLSNATLAQWPFRACLTNNLTSKCIRLFGRFDVRFFVLPFKWRRLVYVSSNSIVWNFRFFFSNSESDIENGGIRHVKCVLLRATHALCAFHLWHNFILSAVLQKVPGFINFRTEQIAFQKNGRVWIER